MGILAFLCIFLGVYPKILYSMLPNPVEFVPYTLTKVFSLTQMFIFTFLGFWLLRKLVGGHATYVLDSDWLVRMPGMKLIQFCCGPLLNFGSYLDRSVVKLTTSFVSTVRNPSIEARMTPTAVGLGVLVTLILFAIFLIARIGV
jgi:multicomponent Na+:H+ antiporter subunit D